MSHFVKLPTPEQCRPGKPRIKKEKLMHEIAKELLFPSNQPHWVNGHPNNDQGFNLRLFREMPAEDILLIEQELVDAGWWIKAIKYRGGYTTVVLVDIKTMKIADWSTPIIVNPLGNKWHLIRTSVYKVNP